MDTLKHGAISTPSVHKYTQHMKIYLHILNAVIIFCLNFEKKFLVQDRIRRKYE